MPFSILLEGNKLMAIALYKATYYTCIRHEFFTYVIQCRPIHSSCPLLGMAEAEKGGFHLG